MRLLRFDNAADVADALGDVVEAGIAVSLIVAHEVSGEPEADGNAHVITPRELLPGYWVLADAPDLPEEVATLDAVRVVATTRP